MNILEASQQKVERKELRKRKCFVFCGHFRRDSSVLRRMLCSSCLRNPLVEALLAVLHAALPQIPESEQLQIVLALCCSKSLELQFVCSGELRGHCQGE